MHARQTTVMRMMTNDQELAMAAAAGDGAAFASLLERHYDRIFAFSFRLTGSRSEAEELTQDICLSLPAKMASYTGRSKVTTWLYRVVVNAAHDRRRKQARYGKAAAGWGEWEQNRSSTNAENAAAVDWLYQAMATLAEPLRDTLSLTLDDVTHAEAAEILGVSEGTVSWRVSEAKKALRALRETEDRI